MKRYIHVVSCLIILATFLLACNTPQPLPTPLPVASVPADDTVTTPSPTPTVAQSTPAPTPTDTASAPEPTPTPPVTGPSTAAVTISDPAADMTLLLGSEILIRGRAQLPAGARLQVSLLSQNWLPLATSEVMLGEVGWETRLSIPYEVGGNGRIVAAVLDEDDNILADTVIRVWLQPDSDNMDRYLLLNRPVTDNVAVRGFNFLFDGTVFNPANNTVSISIWANDCQVQVAQQNFVLGSSVRPFSWHGFIIVPGEADGVGESCAIARVGQPGEPGWREIQIPIIVYPTSAAESRQIEIARPLPQTIYQAGDRLFVYGTAPGITEGVVLVSVLLENGRIIDENEVATDLWGYWEFETNLPPDVDGPAQISVSAGELDEPGYILQQTIITIQPVDPDTLEAEEDPTPDPDEDDGSSE